MAAKKQSKVGKMKTGIAGGAILGLLILGAYLGQLFNFNGPGSGGDSNSEKETPADVQVKAPVDTDSTTGAGDKSEGQTGKSEVIEVIIDEKDYLLKQGEKPFKKISIDQLISLTKQAPGNSDGLRLRIYRKPTSKTSAEVKLQQAIDEAKIPELAVYHVQKLFEE